MLSSLYSLYANYTRRLADRRALLGMSDRELSDIGISRGMIDRVTHTSMLKAPGQLDAVRHSFGFAQVFSGH